MTDHRAAAKKKETTGRVRGPAGLRVARLLSSVRPLLPVALATALPVILAGRLWEDVWGGALVRAWDGTGHYALAQIYASTIFPETFGWTHAYFAGMPFPNFYPPVFYWLVAALHATQLFSLLTAFKVLLSLSVLLIPGAVWVLARAVSGGDRLTANCAAFAVVPLLVDERFYYPVGLNYFGTFSIGLFTQPLGFVLLAGWYAAYLRAGAAWREVSLSAVLLALTVLANFFNAITAFVFVAFTLLVELHRRRTAHSSDGARRRLAALLLSPLLAAGLTAFWTVPVLTSYDYFVTRPQTASLAELVPVAAWVWYTLALAGAVFSLRDAGGRARAFLLAVLTLAAGVAFASTLAPRWFPLQGPRFLSTVNFLLAVPVGRLLAWAVRALAAALGEGVERRGARARVANGGHDVAFRAPVTTVALLCVLLPAAALLIRPTGNKLAFYMPGQETDISRVLEFARNRRDGRYLVEVPPFSSSEAAFDGRAITSYLGAQGNETLSVVFREASPGALFVNPLVNAFSAFPDSFGISSVLADDLDFFEQPLARHIGRASLFGTKYIVAISPWIKDRLGREPEVENRFDLGDWSVFALRGDPVPRVRGLAYRPALVVSDLSLKARRRDELSFIRLAEEQFADGWFDVLLARSPESRIDHLDDLENFGALVLDTYRCDDEAVCVEKLRDFAEHRAVILISSDAPLYGRLREALSTLPLVKVLERPGGGSGPWLEPYLPQHRYDASPARRLWAELRQSLDARKVSAGEAGEMSLTHRFDSNSIEVEPAAPMTGNVPVLVNTTFHPNWKRTDGEAVYVATPFSILTFLDGPAQLTYGRRPHEFAAMLLSAGLLMGVCLFPFRRRLFPWFHRKD